MDELLKSIILGIVQGLTEFLPISSSGHLVIFQELLNFEGGGLALEVFVHFGTLVAVLVAFRHDVWEMIRWLPGVPSYLMNGLKIRNEADEYRAMSFFIIIGSIPAALVGLLFKDQIEALFDSMYVVMGALMVTALVMWSSRYPKESRPFPTWVHAILIGCAQAFAIIPGISRSGSTIVTGLWLGIRKEIVAKFSFLLSVPVILGASLLQFKEMMESQVPMDQLFNLGVATVAAAVSGYLAIIWMLDIIKRQKLEWFGVYCAVVSISGFVYLIFFQSA